MGFGDKRCARFVSQIWVQAVEVTRGVHGEVCYFYTAEPNLELKISGVYEKKLAALAQHRSQFPPASEQYQSKGPPTARSEMEQMISFLTRATQIEYFRRR